MERRIQNDFAARMAWCNTDYKAANHPPVAKLNMPEQLKVKSGETLISTAVHPMTLMEMP
jgi:hypothetical protein